MKIPGELKYSADHEWVRLEGNKAVVGISDYAQAQLGDVVFVELPEVGANTAVGKVLSVIESVKAVSDIKAPVSGVIVRVNAALADMPEAVNQDPYGEGWIVEIELKDRGEIDNLMGSPDYEKFLAEEGN